MVCSSGIGFDPVLDGRRLRFGFQGIYQGTALLYDRETGSLWLHLTGEAIEGPLAGRRLEPLRTGRHTRWAAWRQLHPEAEVMAPDPRFAADYFSRQGSRSGDPWLSDAFRATIHDRDPRLKLHDLVHGVAVGEAARAYPHAALFTARAPVHDRLGDRDLVVLHDPEARSAAAYDRRLPDGRGGERLLTFRAAARVGRFVDEETGTTWDMDGRAIAGALEGARLDRVPGLQSEWYGWYANHPATTIWRR